MSKRDDREGARQSQLKINKSHYNAVKQQLQEGEERRKLFLERHTLENQKKKMHIQQQLLKGSMHISEYRNKQNERQLENYRKQIQEEENAKQRKQYEIYQMEQLELTLIKKLQATQQVQRKCFDELQGVITMKTSEFKSEYKPVFSRKKVHKMIMSQTQSVMQQEDQLGTERKLNTHQSLEHLGGHTQTEQKKDNLEEHQNGDDHTQTQQTQKSIQNLDQNKENSIANANNTEVQNTQTQQQETTERQSHHQKNQNSHQQSVQKEGLDDLENEDEKKKRKKSKLRKRKVSSKKKAKEYPDFVF